MVDDRLLSVLEQSKGLGFLGPGPVDDHVDHAHRFTCALKAFLADNPEWWSSRTGPGRHPRLVDLGAGGGLPSLPMLVGGGLDGESPGERLLAHVSAVLIDSSQKRCSFLVWACAELGLSDRVEVWCGRVEEIAHQDRARFGFDVVVARGFGPPAWTVECGAPLLTRGGLLCISEPPERRSWPAGGLAMIGLRGPLSASRDAGDGDGDDGRDVAVFQRIGTIDAKFPRRTKAGIRDPLFRVGD